jgi:hypothetical protein
MYSHHIECKNRVSSILGKYSLFNSVPKLSVFNLEKLTTRFKRSLKVGYMKKIVLLLLISLLIVSMAGGAHAADVEITIRDPNLIIEPSITVYPGSSNYLNLNLNTFWLHQFPNNYRATLSVTGDGISAHMANNELGLTTSQVATPGNSVTGSQVLLPIQGGMHRIVVDREVGKTGEGRVTLELVDIYNIRCIISATIATTVTDGAAIHAPEFPTVALPVAAIIGLLFVIGRKKEGL